MNRRRLLTRIVAGFSAIAITGFSFPFLKSLLPGFSNRLVLDVDTAGMRAGDVKVVRWLGRNVLVIRRDVARVRQLSIKDEDLVDPASRQNQQPRYAKNPWRSRKPEHLIVFSNCTHLGCEIVMQSPQGFRCPCHSSKFDIAGRVQAGSAARLNLEVPEYDYVARDTIRLVSEPGTT